jgi:hypothetical protein
MKLIVLILLVLTGCLFLIINVFNIKKTLYRSGQLSRNSNTQISYKNNPIYRSSNEDFSYFWKGHYQRFIKKVSTTNKFVFQLLFYGLALPYVAIFSIALFLKLPKYLTIFEKIKRELDEYLNTVIPKIFSDWDFCEFTRKASFNLLKTLGKDELQKIFYSHSQIFGRLTYYQASSRCLKNGVGLWVLTDLHPKNLWKILYHEQDQTKYWKIIANYTTEVVFEKSRAEIEIQVVKEYDRYFINSLNINIGSKLSQHSFKLGIPATLDESRYLRNLHLFFKF